MLHKHMLFLNNLKLYGLIGILMCSVCGGCTHMPASDSSQYNRDEIARLTHADFNAETAAMRKALKPTYAKYGAPHAYIRGNMSTVLDNPQSQIFGMGEFHAKLKLPDRAYWQMGGTNLYNLDTPIPTVHLIYDVKELPTRTKEYKAIGSLSKRGKTFTVFEHKADEHVVVTVYRTEDVYPSVHLQSLMISRAGSSGL